MSSEPRAVARGPCAGDPEFDEPVAGFDYELPAELIAQVPAPEREAARLLVLRGGEIHHSSVAELPGWLGAGDLLVVNRSRVIQARLRGRSVPSGGRVEILLVAAVGATPPADRPEATPERWRALARPARRLKSGSRVLLLASASASRDAGVEVTIERVGDGWVEVSFPPGVNVLETTERIGEPPLPPYIRRPAGPLESDRERYQTVFAAEPGSIAAPTAGLHLGAGLLARLRGAGVRIAEVVLHVGPSTFLAGRPGRGSVALEPERYIVPRETRAAIAATSGGQGRVIAVGTTTTRALESAARAGWPEGEQLTGLFLKPGSRFEVVGGLMTNFHLPGSSLLALVSGFAGVERTRAAYRAAVAERYRFYSYGDAMLIL